MLKIYTKTGDGGKTSLYGGKRVSKSDLRVEAYGEVDELNSLIGVIIVQSSPVRQAQGKVQSYPAELDQASRDSLKLKVELISIQKDLLNMGSILANPVSKRSHLLKGATLMQRVSYFEKLIDGMSKNLPELKNFILPGGGEAGSLLHFARSVCRRTERRVVALSEQENINSSIIIYFNRLSDLLFVMARYINYKENKKEIIWNKK